MADTNVRVVFSGSSGGARRASDETADGIKQIGRAGREAAHGVDEIRERAEAGTRAINEERRAMDRLKVASLLGGGATAAKWGLLSAGIASLGAVAIGATASLAPLAGGLAVLPGLATGAGLAFGTLTLGLGGLGKALHGNKKALEELTPAGRQFVATLKTFEPLIDKLRSSAQKGLFPGLLDALNQLKTPAFFATINKAIGEMGTALGNVARQFGRVVGSQKFLQTFAVVSQSAAHWMEQFGTFASKSFDAMISLTKAAIPLTNWMGELSVRFATWLDNSIKAASASGKLQGFFDGVRKSITLVGHTLGSLGLALFDIGRIAKPFGDALLQVLGQGADAIRKFVDSAKGHAAITAFFDSVKNALRGLAPIAGGLLVGIANVVPHVLNALGDLARALAPALVLALKLASGALAAFYDLLGSGFRALGPVVQRGTDAVRVHMSGIKETAQRVVSYFRANFLPPLTSVMRSVATAGRALAGVIRANWPQISSIARSMGVIVTASLKLIAQSAKELGPTVRALGPLFHAAGIVISVAMKGLALLVRGAVASMIYEMRAVGFAAHAMAAAVEHPINAIKVVWAGLRTAASHTIHFLVDTAALKAAMGAIHGLEAAWNALRSAASHVIHFFSSTTHTTTNTPVPSWRGRAAGGFIPGPQGAPVPILAHAGEVILNRSQQEALGGPRLIASMFGFTGDEGPGFAGGGFVRLRPRPKRRPSHPLRARAKAASKAGKLAFAAADAFAQREDDLKRTTDQLDREYSISPDATGSPGLDAAEIDSLIARKEELLALFDQEKLALEKALAALQKAIAALVREIKSERAAIDADLRKIALERRKRKPNGKLIASLQKDVSSRRTVIGSMQSELTGIRADVKTEKRRHDFDVGFDRRDTELDILDLREQRREYLAALADSGGGGGGGDLGGGGGDTGGGGGAGGPSPRAAELLAIIGQLRLALGIQNVQVPIIGSFAKGTLTVPAEGLYHLHGGEAVTPAGRGGGGDGGSIGEVHVHIDMNADLEAINPKIDARVMKNADRISTHIGRRADTRRRAGNF